MDDNIERLIKIIKQQAEAFLLDAQEFYPFGTAINMLNEIVPFSVYFGEEFPQSQKVIDELEKVVERGLSNGEKKISAIALDVLLTENNVRYDALQIRFFEVGKHVWVRNIKYKIKENSVEFFDD